MPQPLVILGTRAFAEEVADLVEDTGHYELVAFAENWDRTRAGGSLLGRPIVWVDDLAPLARTTEAICAIGTTRRVAFLDQAARLGFRFATVVHPTARVSRTTVLGKGTLLSAGVVGAAHATIGNHVIVNRGVLIGHHTRVGNVVTIAPGCNIAGRVTIGAGSYLGMGAIILNDITIGEGCVVAAGAVVTRDVPDHVEVAGRPGRTARSGVDGR